MSAAFADLVRRRKLIAILRGVPDRHVVELARAICDGGIDLIEVSLSGEGAIAQLSTVRKRLGEDVHLGAGTVRTVLQAHEAREAGATYIITPHVREDVAAYAKEHELGLMLGAMTPTEIEHARSLGSDVVKVFPASTVGPAFFKSVLGPFPDAALVAVGGVDRSNLTEYLGSGAVGAGIGSSLTSLDWGAPDFDRVRTKAAALVEAARHHTVP